MSLKFARKTTECVCAYNCVFLVSDICMKVISKPRLSSLMLNKAKPDIY